MYARSWFEWIKGFDPPIIVNRQLGTARELTRLILASRLVEDFSYHNVALATASLVPPQDAELEDFAPCTRHAWSFERLHLCLSPPVCPPIAFGFASSALTTVARQQIAALAERLRPHPGLRVRVFGYARREAPSAAQGLACAQARATRVRQWLLQLLQRGSPASPWREDDADEGVRPGGYSEDTDEELRRSIAFYTPSGAATPVGSRVVAVGCFPETKSRWSSASWRWQLQSARADNSSMAEIVVTGFEPASANAF